MKIVHVYPEFVAPARDQQGTQRVLQALAKGHKELGHKVYLMIHPDSKTNLGEVVTQIPEDHDIVHYHGGVPDTYGHNVKNWVATTHAGPVPLPHDFELEQKYKHHIIAISDSARINRQLLTYVHNCVDPSELVFLENKSEEDYFLWIGSTDWGEEKGLFSTVALAKRMRLNLKIAGTGNNLYTLEQLKNQCQGNIQYLGPVNGEEKAKLIANANALFMIGRIEDGCPLTSIEALFSGTPVIARDVKIHKEMLTPEVGFICKSDADIAKAVLNVDKISPINCRMHALSMFNYLSQADKYVDAYKRIIETGSVANG
jgi:glycosyltransferase involved in cell wall biosynthesis